uniref:Lipoxygenase n=1 Tax=Lobosphaera incisa TaxID=312850 RepID=A0A3G6V563_9CHLO|nr:lipoxygenase [Lobosphaera incisa]
MELGLGARQAVLQPAAASRAPLGLLKAGHRAQQRRLPSVPSVSASASVTQGIPQTSFLQKARDSVLPHGAPFTPTSKDSVQWTTTIYTTQLLRPEIHDLGFVEVLLASEDKEAVSERMTLKGFSRKPWTNLDGVPKWGAIFTGTLMLPAAMAKPAVMFININHPPEGVQYFFANKIALDGPPGKTAHVDFVINSHVDSGPDAPRPFFTAQAYLPHAPMPDYLAELREHELAILRGTAAAAKHERKGSERIYDYDVYNDLGTPTRSRPALGGDTLKYPRRLRTGRRVVNGTEVAAKGKDWLPPDERFDDRKQENFDSRTLLATLPALSANLLAALVPAGLQKLLRTPGSEFMSISDIEQLYSGNAAEDNEDNVLTNLVAPAAAPLAAILGLLTQNSAQGNTPQKVFEQLSDFNKEVVNGALDALVVSLDDLGQSQRAAILHALSLTEKDFQEYAQAGTGRHEVHPVHANFVNLLQEVLHRLLHFSTPAVIREGREGAWTTDEEWGREQLAGQNACMIHAIWNDAPIKDLPADSAITEAVLQGHLEGHSISQLLSGDKPRLFLIDYMKGFKDYAEKIAAAHPGNVMYAGRAVLYLRTDGELVPVAIELQAPRRKLEAFTSADSPTIWLLAKCIFSSIDAGYHQLISHFVRAHACTEPYIIATRRQLSVMHPVFKLLITHCRFTLNVNSNARQQLINAGGIIEGNFTPGRYAMELSSVVYGLTWTFDSQALPHDLVNRGVARREKDGTLKLLMADYPYAADGLLVWDAFVEWFDSYLRLYYDDEVDGKRVTDDPEITAWWTEIQEKGHPDIKEGWPQLQTIADLTQILTTIAWIASAHHAAINYGQYDYSGFMPNRSPMIRKAMPPKESDDFKTLAAQDAETAILPFLASPLQATQVMATLGLLSTHSENEEYINDLEHPYLMVGTEAYNKYKEFLSRLKQAEDTIKKRNADSQGHVIRAGPDAIHYRLMNPSSITENGDVQRQGVTMSGIPTSVSM